MGNIIDLQESEMAFPKEEQSEIVQIANDVIQRTYAKVESGKTMSVPLSSLGALGMAVSKMLPAFRTITQTTTVNMDGLYTLANAGAGDALKIAKNGNYWGALKTAEGTSKFAQLQKAAQVGSTTVTTLPIDPATMMMAVALYSIEKELKVIEKVQKQILNFLAFEKEAEIEADVQTLSSMISNYKFNWDNERFMTSNHKMVCDIKRSAVKNVRNYQKQVASSLGEQQKLIRQKTVDENFKEFQKMFQYYQMSLFTYSLASLLEIMLSGNFKEEYICTVKDEIEKFAMEYRSWFDRTSMYLEEMSSGAIDTKLLKGIGTMTKHIGGIFEKIPVAREKQIDEVLEKTGMRVSDKARDVEEKTVRDFAILGNPGTVVLTEKMQDMIQIYNHTDNICFDSKKIYLIEES